MKWQDGVNQSLTDLDALVLSMEGALGAEISIDIQMGIDPALGDGESAHLLTVWALA